jgi:GlpG protein
MRAVGHLPDETRARRLSDYLAVQGIANQVEPDDHGRWTLWIHEDDQVARGQELLAEFLEQPDDRRYHKAATSARKLRESEQQEEKAWQKRLFDRRSLWRGVQAGIGWLTASLVAGCIAVALVECLQGPDSPLIRALYMTEITEADGRFYYTQGLPEIHAGQLWRLITPVFVHLGVLHLVFNMLWLVNLGSLLENRQSAGRLAVKVAILAVVSNLGQYYVSGPAFGGMSGVVYGLFGYIWLRSKLDARSGFYIDPTSVTIMVVWFFVCLTGAVGPVANMAHAAGLGLGLVWGYLATRLNREF